MTYFSIPQGIPMGWISLLKVKQMDDNCICYMHG